jgi:hypothetical protein
MEFSKSNKPNLKSLATMIKNRFLNLDSLPPQLRYLGHTPPFSSTALAEKRKTIGLAVANLRADFFNQITICRA